MTRLTSDQFVELAGGLTVPVEAFVLAHELSRRDLILRVQGDLLRIQGPGGTKPDLSPEDMAKIRRWKAHLIALLDYRAPKA